MAKGYIIGMVTVNNPQGYTPYMQKTGELVAEYGGSYLVRGGEKTVVEGELGHDRMVVIEFPSIEIAQKFYDDPRYIEARKIRQDNSDGIIVQVAQGVCFKRLYKPTLTKGFTQGFWNI
jgi:uncharacterized protein (DUF1330 family)